MGLRTDRKTDAPARGEIITIGLETIDGIS
jgi:hypothetical protein